MQVKELLEQTNWKVLTGDVGLTNEISGCFVGDLLSFVMGNGETDNIWVTIQAHINVVAVAMLREFSCVIICESIIVSPEIIAKAKEENVVLISCNLSIFDCVKKLIAEGV